MQLLCAHIAHDRSIHTSQNMTSVNHMCWLINRVKHLKRQRNLQSECLDTRSHTVANTAPADVVGLVKKNVQKPITACSAGAETEPSRSSETKELVYKAPNEAALRQNAFCAVKLTGLVQNNKVRKLSVGSVRSLWRFLAARKAQSGVTGNVPETQLRNVVNRSGVFPQAGLPRRRFEVCRSPANT